MNDKKTTVVENKPSKAARRAWTMLGVWAVAMLAFVVVGWALGRGQVIAVILVALVVFAVILAPFLALDRLISKVREEDPAEYTAQGKPYPKWKLWLRRTTRKT